MFKKLLKNKKAQQTAEFALLISLVVAAVIAMQTYAQRAIQARIRGATQYLVNQTNELGSVGQYEAYYQSSNYEIDNYSQDKTKLSKTTAAYDKVSNRTRTGDSGTSYDTAFGLINGL